MKKVIIERHCVSSFINGIFFDKNDDIDETTSKIKYLLEELGFDEIEDIENY